MVGLWLTFTVHRGIVNVKTVFVKWEFYPMSSSNFTIARTLCGCKCLAIPYFHLQVAMIELSQSVHKDLFDLPRNWWLHLQLLMNSLKKYKGQRSSGRSAVVIDSTNHCMFINVLSSALPFHPTTTSSWNLWLNLWLVTVSTLVVLFFNQLTSNSTLMSGKTSLKQ